MNTVYERYLQDEDFRAAIVDTARRERVAAIDRLIVQPLKALLTAPRLRPSRMLHRSATC